MAKKRKGIRGRLTRNRSIALGIVVIAFAVVVVGGADIGIDIFQAGGFDGVKFSVQVFDQIIPLELLGNFALQCDVWTESTMFFKDGSSRSLPSGTGTITQVAPLAVIDQATLKEMENVFGTIKLRCQSPYQIGSLISTGGEVVTYFDVVKADDGKTQRFTKVTPLGRMNLLTQGTTIDTFTLSASDINNAIATNDQDYFVNFILLNQLTLELEAVADGMTSQAIAVVGFSSYGGNGLLLHITGDGSGTPLVVSDNTVKIFRMSPSTFDLKITPTPEVTTLVELPNFQSFESGPQLDIHATSTVTGLETGPSLYHKSSGRSFGMISGFGVPPNTFLADQQLFGIQPGIYINVATSVDRTGVAKAYLQVLGENQGSVEPIPTDPEPIDDPCSGISDPLNNLRCEETLGMLLTCDSPTYVKLSREDFNTIASTAGVIIQIQPGTSVNDNTTQVCLAQESIDIFEALGGVSAPAPVDGAPPPGTVNLAAQALILYEVAYNGESDVGSIRDIETTDVVFALLELAGQPPSKEEFFSLARIHVNPVIDVTDIPATFGEIHSAVFTYKWTGAVTRLGTTESADIGILDECIPAGFGTTTGNISPVTRCTIFDMSSVSVTTGGGNLGLEVEDDIQGGRFFQIARSSIQPSQINTALQNKMIPLNDGDLFDLTLEVAGTFKVGQGDLERIGAVAPMTWTHQFTWIDALAPEPCSGLSGLAKINCLGGSTDSGGTCEGLTSLECWLRNHPLLPKVNESDPDCRNQLVGNKVIVVCEADPSPEKKSTLAGDPGSSSSGEPGVAGICPEGTSATVCTQLVLRILEERLAGLLGVTGPALTTISNNALLIIASIIAIIVIALVVRAVIRRRRKF